MLKELKPRRSERADGSWVSAIADPPEEGLLSTRHLSWVLCVTRHCRHCRGDHGFGTPCHIRRTVAPVPTCLLIRHGRTSSNAKGTLAGWTEGVGLDDVGRSQAAALAERLAGLPIRALVSSPLQRCLETAQIVLSGLKDVSVRTDERLGECRYGAWTGGSLKELAKEPLWRTVQNQPSAARFPDGEGFIGESIAQMQARGLQAVRDIDAAVNDEHGPGAIWALVSHGDIIKSILADAAGAHLDHFQRIIVGPASLSVVSYTQRRPYLVRLNDDGTDLSALVPPPGDAPVGGGAGTAH
jgi:2,3-bisphosphoglycerate-dependent phosphoglycerate mutase